LLLINGVGVDRGLAEVTRGVGEGHYAALCDVLCVTGRVTIGSARDGSGRHRTDFAAPPAIGYRVTLRTGEE